MQGAHQTRVAVIGPEASGGLLVAQIFRKAGHDVREALTGNQGIAMLKEQTPELVVFHLPLIDMGGLEACRRVRRNPRMANAAVMLISPPSTRSIERVECLDAGADACLVEPLEPGEVLAQADCILRLRQVEAQLRESEERFRLASEAVNGLVYDWHVVEGISKRSAGLAEFLGWKQEEVPEDASWWLQQIHPDDLTPVQERFNGAVAKGVPTYRHEYRIRHKQGHYIWIWDSTRIVYNAAAKPVRVIGCAISIDERKRIEQALRVAKEDLARTNEQLEEKVIERTAQLAETMTELESWSYSIAHDMRAPLRTMTGFSRMILEEYASVLGQPARNYLERISTAASRLDQYITDLLDYSRIVRGDLPLARVDTAGLIGEILATYPNLQPPNCEIQIREPLASVLANTAALTQVISNLLDNATKFVANGTAPKVTIHSEEKTGWIRLWFEDNGIGIDERAQDRIFGIFQCLHPSGAYAGTGIGLAIVRRAVERMGGRVGVESQPGEGSRFWVELRSP